MLWVTPVPFRQGTSLGTRSGWTSPVKAGGAKEQGVGVAEGFQAKGSAEWVICLEYVRLLEFGCAS